MVKSSLCILPVLYTGLPGQLPVYDTNALTEHSSVLLRVLPFPSAARHQKVRLPENQFLHIYRNKMVRFRTL